MESSRRRDRKYAQPEVLPPAGDRSPDRDRAEAPERASAPEPERTSPDPEPERDRATTVTPAEQTADENVTHAEQPPPSKDD